MFLIIGLSILLGILFHLILKYNGLFSKITDTIVFDYIGYYFTKRFTTPKPSCVKSFTWSNNKLSENEKRKLVEDYEKENRTRIIILEDPEPSLERLVSMSTSSLSEKDVEKFLDILETPYYNLISIVLNITSLNLTSLEVMVRAILAFRKEGGMVITFIPYRCVSDEAILLALSTDQIFVHENAYFRKVNDYTLYDIAKPTLIEQLNKNPKINFEFGILLNSIKARLDFVKALIFEKDPRKIKQEAIKLVEGYQQYTTNFSEVLFEQYWETSAKEGCAKIRVGIPPDFMNLYRQIK